MGPHAVCVVRPAGGRPPESIVRDASPFALGQHQEPIPARGGVPVQSHAALEHVLLVDDQPAILDAAATALTRSGYQVHTTSSPQHAIELALRQPIDALVIDFLLPEMSGVELLRILRGVYPDLAAVLITGHGTLEVTIDALRAGATGFLLKPFTAAELRTSVDEALTRSRVLKENQRLKAL